MSKKHDQKEKHKDSLDGSHVVAAIAKNLDDLHGKPARTKPANTSQSSNRNNSDNGGAEGSLKNGAGSESSRGDETSNGQVLRSLAAMTKMMGQFGSKLDAVNTDIKALKEGQGFLENQMLEWEMGPHSDNQEQIEYYDSDQDHHAEAEVGNISEEGELEEDAPPPKQAKMDTKAPEGRGARVLAAMKQRCGLLQAKQPPIDEEWAAAINQTATNGMEEQTLKDRRAQILEVENLPMLAAPRLNECVWGIINKETRTRDSTIQSVQKSITKGLTPIIKMADELNKAARDGRSVDLDETFANIAEGVELILCGHHSLSMYRRDMVKPDLNQDFKSICSHNCAVTKELFGDNLPDKLTAIGVSNRAASKVKQQRRPAASGSRPWTARPRPSFRGRGGFNGYSGYSTYNNYRGGFSNSFRGRARSSFLAHSPQRSSTRGRAPEKGKK